jgi:hypothetical protein
MADWPAWMTIFSLAVISIAALTEMTVMALSARISSWSVCD